MNSSRPIVRWSVVVLAAIGCLICLILLNMSVGDAAAGQSPAAAFLCSPSQSVNCDYVLASPWARVGPLPVAAIGLMYFAVIGAWFVSVGIPSGGGRRWHALPMMLTSLGLAGSAYFTFIMATSLPVWCTWCLAAHGVNAAIFLCVVLVRSGRVADASAPPHPTTARALTTIFGCVGGAAIIFFAVFGYRAQLAARRMQLELMAATNNADYIAWKYTSGPNREIAFRPDAASLGPTDASHILVAFTDFECRHCGWFHTYADRLAQIFPSQLRIVFLHAPMCRECNPKVTKVFHYFACEAARAAEAARLASDPEKARAYQSLLFAHADELAARPYSALAGIAKIDVAKFEKLMPDERSERGIKADIELAGSLGIDATPSLWLDGRKLPTWCILSEDPNPKIDVARTDDLWRRLLNATSATRPAQGN